MKKHPLAPLILLIILLSLLPLLLLAVGKIQEIRKRAAFISAKVIVDASVNLGPLPRPWENLAQGGEEFNRPMLGSAINYLRPLKPSYIRIDHIFDAYDLITQINPDQSLNYNWSRLDQTIDHILTAGATPMLALSYMPTSLASDNIISPPTNWLLWQQLVKDTIEHYSGTQPDQKAIPNIYYEVWNEPDLFGHWRFDTADRASYLTLYQQSLLGAGQTQNTLPFKIGGPSVTDPGPQKIQMIEQFLNFIDQNNLRLDFLSWHRYHSSIDIFMNDLDNFDRFLRKHPRYQDTEIILSEWGSNPENSFWHDSIFDAAHTVSAVRQFLNRIDAAYSFEIKDGPDPKGQTFWGRWGLLTHDSTGLFKKPRYYALLLLTKMKPQRIALNGEGSFVTGFASKQENSFSIILSNFDQTASHYETFPLLVQNLTPGLYQVRETLLSNQFPETQTLESRQQLAADFFHQTVSLPPNSVFLLELDKLE